MSSDEVYDHARKRVEAKIGFYIHLGVFICVNALLIGVNLAMTPDNLWFVWPLVGWGIGIFFHGLTVFLFASGGKVKERMIEKEVERQDTARHIPYSRDDDPL
ncbi:MAG: 2TM domain-containing protein [Alphaproteobacteria bacterium]